VTPLERRYRWLLRAYPAWYRRDRAAEMLATLLEASPPGRRWPSLRDARALVTGGLRVRAALLWCLSMVWAASGAAGASYVFTVSAHVPENPVWSPIPSWVSEPDVAALAAGLGAVAWVLLTIPVLVAGLRRLRLAPWTGWWALAWTAGLALMYPIATWYPAAPVVWACSKGQGCAFAGYRYAVVSWGELAVLAGWLALGAAMAVVLTRRPRGRDLSGASSRSSPEASI
jgi:hypothetical protein